MFKVKDEKLIPKYIGEVEIYFPLFENKIVKTGDLVRELPIEEAKNRSDFTVIYESEVKNGRI